MSHPQTLPQGIRLRKPQSEVQPSATPAPTTVPPPGITIKGTPPPPAGAAAFQPDVGPGLLRDLKTAVDGAQEQSDHDDWRKTQITLAMATARMLGRMPPADKPGALERAIRAIVPTKIGEEFAVGFARGAVRGAADMGGLIGIAGMMAGDNPVGDFLTAYADIQTGMSRFAESRFTREEMAPFSAGNIARTVGEATPTFAAQIAMALGTGGGSLPAQIAIFSGTAAAPVVGSTYIDAIDSGQAEGTAAMEAGAAGLITAITSLVPGRALLSKIPGADVALGAAARRIIGRAAMGAATESLQEMTEQVLQDAVAELMRDGNGEFFQPFDPEQAWGVNWDYLQQVGLAGLVGGILGGGAGLAIETDPDVSRGTSENGEDRRKAPSGRPVPSSTVPEGTTFEAVGEPPNMTGLVRYPDGTEVITSAANQEQAFEEAMLVSPPRLSRNRALDGSEESRKPPEESREVWWARAIVGTRASEDIPRSFDALKPRHAPKAIELLLASGADPADILSGVAASLKTSPGISKRTATRLKKVLAESVAAEAAHKKLAEGRDVSERLVSESDIRFKKKPKGAKLNKSEQAVMDRFAKGPLQMKRVSRALQYTNQARAGGVLQQRALISLIDRGALRVIEKGDAYYIATEAQWLARHGDSEPKTVKKVAEGTHPAVDESPETTPESSGPSIRPLAAASIDSPKATTPSSPRIEPDPIPGGKVKPLRLIVINAAKAFGVRVRTAQPSRNTMGTFFPGSARTVIRFANDLDTTAHELAHALDQRYGIIRKWAIKRARSPFDDELIPAFSQHGSSKKSGPKSKLRYKRAEGVAEWIRAFIVNPDAAKAAAPKFYKHYTKTISPRGQRAVEDFSADVRAWIGGSKIDQTASNIEMELVPKRQLEKLNRLDPDTGFETNWVDDFKASWTDALAPVWSAMDYIKKILGIEDLLPEFDPKTMVRLLAGFDRKVFKVFQHGPVDAKNQRINGVEGGITWVLDPLGEDSSVRETEDKMAKVAVLLVSERVVSKSKQFQEDADRLTELAQKMKDLRSDIDGGTLTPDEMKTARSDLAAAKKESSKLRGRLGYNGPVDKVGEYISAKVARMSGAGGGIFDDAYQASEALIELQRDPEEYAQLQEAARRYRLWSNAILQYALQKGRISQKTYDAVVEANEYYVSMNRVMDDLVPKGSGLIGGRRPLGTANQILHRFRGSTRTIANPYVSLMMNTAGVMLEADRNEAMRTFTSLLDRRMELHAGEWMQLDSVGSEAKAGDPDTIKVFVKGEAKYYQFHPDIYKALKGVGEQKIDHVILRLVSIAAVRIPRWAITRSPAFFVRNIIRDQFYRAIVSDVGSTPWAALYLAEDPDETSKALYEFEIAGGGLFGFFGQSKESWHRELRKAVRNTANGHGTTVFTFPSKLMRFGHNLFAASETTGRLTEYKAAKKKAVEELGYDEHNASLYAAAKARDLMDYAIAGNYIRSLNKYVLFLNATIRGVAKTLDTVQKSPARTFAKGMLYLAPLSLLEYILAILGDNEDELNQEPGWRRDYFWNFKIGADTWLRIPKPWELGVVSTLPSRLFAGARGQKNAMDDFVHSLWTSVFGFVDPGSAAGPARLPIELAANYDFFRERAIVPYWEIERDLDLRDPKYASVIGRKVQDLVGVDARKVDHIIRSQFGGMGQMAIETANLAEPEKRSDAKKRLAQASAGVLAPGVAYRARDVQWVYERARGRGKWQSKKVKGLRDKMEQYFESDDPKVKEKLTNEILESAASIRKWIEDGGWD